MKKIIIIIIFIIIFNIKYSTMEKEDYYKILGVNKSSRLNEIKRAYKKLVLKYHPGNKPNNI
jgi:curved DNA-binding protein